MMLSAKTRVAGVIGDPIRHSRSPAIHNAAFEALGLDWVFVAFEVAADEGQAAVRAVGPLGLGGLSVTMPHKAVAAAACDRLSDAARGLSAVNAVVPTADGLFGDSTDGEGFLRALADEGVEPGVTEAVVLGAGGAARAIIHALGTAGASVTVAARRTRAARDAAALAPDGRALPLDEADEALEAATLVVNATPLGMGGEEPPFRTDLLGPKQVVVDAVYDPPLTPLIAAARARGAHALNGMGMLVHQAAIAFELWTGEVPPLDVMRQTATADRSG